MAETLGSLVVRVGLDGSDFDRGLKNINSQMALAKSEMRAASGSFNNFGKSTDALKTKQTNLAKQYALQGERVNELKGQYDSLVKSHGAESDAALRAGAKLNNAIGTYNKMGQELGSLSEQLRMQESRWYKAQQGMQSFSDKTGRIGDKMTGVGKKLSTRVTLPILGIGAAALKVGMDFEASMSEVAAITGATGDDFDALRDSAREMGKQTKFSASEAAQAQKYMGLKTRPVIEKSVA